MQDYKNERDDALVLLSKGGDAAATEELLRRYKETVLRCARKCAFSLLAEVDDLAQEGMIGLCSAISGYLPTEGRSFKNFVYVCVVRRINSYLRTVNRRKPEAERIAFDPEQLSEYGDSPEDVLLGSEADAEFRLRLLKTLSSFEFRVVSMYLEGMTYAQISEATGKEIKSIDNALARSKRKLQKAFSA